MHKNNSFKYYKILNSTQFMWRCSKIEWGDIMKYLEID